MRLEKVMIAGAGEKLGDLTVKAAEQGVPYVLHNWTLYEVRQETSIVQVAPYKPRDI